MVLYPNKLPESERVCSGICNWNTALILESHQDSFNANSIRIIPFVLVPLYAQ